MKCDVTDINHKIRTPVAGILCSLKMLEKSELSVHQIGCIKDIESCSNELLHSVESFTNDYLETKTKHKSSLKILLVEDQPILQKATKFLLEEKGHSVEIAENGKIALEKFINGYDVIFMDIRMSEIDGFEATKTIRQIETVRRTPIIALTAEGITIKDECISAGMDDILIKPFNELELNSLLYKLQQNSFN